MSNHNKQIQGFEITSDDVESILLAHDVKADPQVVFDSLTTEDFQKITQGCEGTVDQMTDAANSGLENLFMENGIIPQGYKRFYANEQEVEIEGGVLELDTNGTIRRRDNHGNTEDVLEPGEEGYDNLIQPFL